VQRVPSTMGTWFLARKRSTVAASSGRRSRSLLMASLPPILGSGPVVVRLPPA
jgi:hypothetical protein